ncbi:hypothetical protein A2U01_0018321, partial [Trifolium medium]|nr:hypothetical protein [Trifolium medium]
MLSARDRFGFGHRRKNLKSKIYGSSPNPYLECTVFFFNSDGSSGKESDGTSGKESNGTKVEDDGESDGTVVLKDDKRKKGKMVEV